MKAAAWLLGALVLPLGVPGTSSHDACERVDAATHTCRWSFQPTPASPAELWPIPVFARTLVTVDVTLLMSPDTGWDIVILDLSEGVYEPVSYDSHPANATPALRHHAKSTHVLDAREGREYALGVTAGRGTPAGATIEVAYVARDVPAGERPTRPAATAADPHLRDEPGETSDPAWDIRAAWLDDARLEDGLFDAHLLVADLTSISDASFRAPAAGPLAAVEPQSELTWKLAWSVTGRTYYVEWSVRRAERDVFRCQLAEEAATPGAGDRVVAIPLCAADLENHTLHAVVPIGAIGSPPSGEVFSQIAARTRIPYGVNSMDVVDEATEPRYLFALGGPEVWERFNPRLSPAATRWYEDPLAPEHAADTLQVAGAAAAIATFLVGLVLVWRRRRHTSRLLARVDALEDQGVDARDTLLALGRLEQEFAAMFRRHRISEAQYQVLSQRIASVATRHALRRELGLDDGVPGEAGPGSVRLRPK